VDDVGSMSRALSQRASQKPSRPASKATAMRSMLCPDFFASLASNEQLQQGALVDLELLQRLALDATIPATSQLERLISITAISVRSGLRGVRIGSGRSTSAWGVLHRFTSTSTDAISSPTSAP